MKIRVTDVKFSFELGSNQSISISSSPCFSFYLFKSDALIKTTNGLNEAKYGDCILFFPEEEIDISPSKDPICFDSIEFKGSDCFRLFSNLGFESSILNSPVQTYFIDACMEKISKEIKSGDTHYEQIISIYVQELFTKISRFVKQDFVLSLPDHAQKLRELRTEVHENFSKRWTIGNMAEIMNLSSSRFASLYKQIFNISPTEDLIRTRIDQSQKMLSATKVSIKKVSVACGFDSVHYFHRAFKKRIGITPKHFQNKMLTNHGSVPTDQNFQSLDSLSLTSDFTGILEIVSGEIVFHGIDTSWSEFLGYSAEELRNKPFMNFVFPEDLPTANEAVNSILKGKNVFNIKIALVTQKGETKNIDFSAVAKGKSKFWFVKSLALETV